MNKNCIQNVTTQIDQFTLSVQLHFDEDKRTLGRVDLDMRCYIAQLEKYLRLTVFEKAKSVSNIKGYNRTYEYGGVGIRIAYHNRMPQQGIVIYFTAGGWLAYQNQVGLNILLILRRLQKLQETQDWFASFRLTRLDYAVDIYDKRAKIDTLAKSINRGTYDCYDARNRRNQQKLKIVYQGSTVQTMYIGSRQSEFFFRCYDKKAEQLNSKNPMYYDTACACQYWFRYEGEMKSDLVHKVTEDLLHLTNINEVNQLLASIILDKIKFRSNKTKRLHYVSRIIKTISNGKEYNNVIRQVRRNQPLEQSKRWFFSDNSGFIGLLYKIREIYGNDGVTDYLNELHCYLDDEYTPSRNVLEWLDNNK